MEVTISEVFDILELLVIVLAMFWVYRSIPSDKVAELLEKLQEAAERTAIREDDIAVETVSKIWDLLLQFGLVKTDTPKDEPTNGVG